MTRQKYTNISLPKELMDAISEFIEKNPGYGFDSRTDLIKHAIRTFIYGEEDLTPVKRKLLK
jgi:metal-responsive CopG/Arc/MetJ family transcriptional regulator